MFFRFCSCNGSVSNVHCLEQVACGCFPLHVASSSFFFAVSTCPASLSESFSFTPSESNVRQFSGLGLSGLGPNPAAVHCGMWGSYPKTVVLLFKRFCTVERDGSPVFRRTAAFQPCLRQWIPVSMRYTYPAFGFSRWPPLFWLLFWHAR